MRKNRLSTTLFLVITMLCGLSATKAQDSLPKLDITTYLGVVKKYHPVIAQSNIGIQQSKAQITVAKAAFDPMLNTTVDRKTFDGTNYFNQANGEIVVPTWYGVDVVGGLESINGLRVNSDATLGNTSYFGLSIPLAKGLLMDKRRGGVMQARLMNQASFTEQKSIINNLVFESVAAYWDWVNKERTFEAYKDIIEVNKKRLIFTKRIVELGERPAIDTVEVLTQLQSFQYAYNEAGLQFGNATITVNTFLWNEKQDLVLLPKDVRPVADLNDISKIAALQLNLENLQDQALQNHPDLVLYKFKLSSLEIDRKVKQQELLPKIDFKYNQLGKGYDLLKTATTGPLFENNFKYGLKVQVPLRFSQGRGEYKIAKLKIENTQLELLQKQVTIKAKIRSYYNEFLNYKNQIELLNSAYINYQRLVRGEETRFKNGESSLFLINSRETKALEAYLKLIETSAKCYKSYYATQWAAGVLF